MWILDHFNVTLGDRPFKLRLADKAWEQGCQVATLEWLGRGVSGSTELVQAVMPNTPPVVSCLTVTTGKADRLEHLKRTISDFCLQSHQQKILQIFVNGLKQDQDIISQYADDLGRNDIHVTPVTGDYTLGELRNISFASASGDIIAQWDDDDRHHPRALEEQLSYLASGGYDAVYLQDLFQYFPLSRSIFWTNWRSTEISGHPEP